MPIKRLIAGEPRDRAGDVCALGSVDPDFGDKVDYADPFAVGHHFGIAKSLAAEIVYENDECGYLRFIETPEDRWTRIRKWVEEQLFADEGRA